MKTTLDLPEDLLRDTEATSARLGCQVEQFVADALREKLQRGATPPVDKPWMKFYGAFAHLPKEKLDAINLRLAECERVDPPGPDIP